MHNFVPGKTHTVLAEGSVTNFTINHLFERITQDVAHRYKVEIIRTCLGKSDMKSAVP